MAPTKQMVNRYKAPTSKILGPKKPKTKISQSQPRRKSRRKPDSKLATSEEEAPPEIPTPRHDTPLEATPPLTKASNPRTAKGRFKAAPKTRPGSSKATPTSLKARPPPTRTTSTRTETTLTLIAIPLTHRAQATALVQDWRAEHQHPRYPTNRNYSHNGYKSVLQTVEEGPHAGEQEEIQIRIGQQGTHTFTGLGIDYVLCYQRRTFVENDGEEERGDADKVEGMMVFFALTKPHDKQNEKAKKAPSYALRNVPRIIVAPFHAGDEFFASLMAKSMAHEVRMEEDVERNLSRACQDWTDVAFLDPNVDENGVVRLDTQIAVADGVEGIVSGDGMGDWAERCRAYNASLRGRGWTDSRRFWV